MGPQPACLLAGVSAMARALNTHIPSHAVRPAPLRDVQFCMYDKDFSGQVSVDETMHMLFARYGKERLESEMKVRGPGAASKPASQLPGPLWRSAGQGAASSPPPPPPRPAPPRPAGAVRRFTERGRQRVAHVSGLPGRRQQAHAGPGRGRRGRQDRRAQGSLEQEEDEQVMERPGCTSRAA
jgi:hypothetical protein